MAPPIILEDKNFYFIFFLATILYLFLHYLVKKLLLPKAPMVNHPPSPLSLPIIGHLHLLRANFHRSLQALASLYGPLMIIRVGATTSYVVSNATVAKEMFKAHDLNFASRPQFGSMEHYIYEGRSMISAEYGPYWRSLKKLCMEEILSAPQLHKFIGIRVEEKSKLLEAIVKCCEKGEAACDLGAELMTFTNNIISRTAMTTRCSESNDESAEIRDFLDGMTALASRLGFGETLGPLKRFDLLGFGKRLKTLMLRYDKLVDGIMTERQKERDDGGTERKDMMDILLDACSNENAQVKLTRDNVKAFLLDIFLAGTESTSRTIQWAVAELINHPDMCRKLRDEIYNIVGMSRLVEESDIPNLPYLQAIMKETLRLHPATPLIMRECKEDCMISDYYIPSGSRILINLYAIMRDQGSWENPKEFLPERFLEKQVDIKGQDFKLVPFGGGRRRCPGIGLAYNVMHVTVATLVQCFDWKNGGNERVDMEEGIGFTMGMAHPLVCFPSLLVNPMDIAPSTI